MTTFWADTAAISSLRGRHFMTLPSRFMPLKTTRRVRFQKVAHGYLFRAPSKKMRIMHSRLRRPNPFRRAQTPTGIFRGLWWRL
jgi:hypothetical protein